MRNIAHLSDLHFGRTAPDVVPALLADMQAQSIDLVVISGDLTQRARPGEFAEARAFLDALRVPCLVVPGNHDVVPIYRPLRRMLDPFGGYRRFICGELAPCYSDAEIAVVGVNTAHPRLISEGRISSQQLEEIARRLTDAADRFKVVVTHHPFIRHPGSPRAPLVGRAARALGRLEAGGVDLLLAGHLHHGFTGDIAHHHAAVTRSILVAQATTTTSSRTRLDENAYNYLSIDRDRVSLVIRAWIDGRFRPLRSEQFARKDQRWQRVA